MDTATAPDSGKARHIDTHTLRFVGAVILSLGIFAGFMVALGTRFDRQVVAVPTASAQEQTRQELAIAATRIARSAASLSADSPENAVLTQVVSSANSYAENLGGVWIPWPSGAPEGQTNPPVATDAPRDASAVALVDELLTLSTDSLSAADSVPESERATYVAISLSAHLSAQNLAASIGAADPGCPSGNALTAGAAVSDSTTLEAADVARQWFEIDASRLALGSRQTELDRIDKLTAFEDSLLSHGTTDTRSAFAAIPSSDGDSLSVQALTLLSRQLVTVSALADHDGRAALVGFSCSLFSSADERDAVLSTLLEGTSN